MVMTVLAALMVASKPMAVPLLLSLVSVRMLSMALSVKSMPLPSALIASSKVSVMFVDASVTVAPLAGSKVAAATPIESTVKVALAVVPWLPAAS